MTEVLTDVSTVEVAELTDFPTVEVAEEKDSVTLFDTLSNPRMFLASSETSGCLKNGPGW